MERGLLSEVCSYMLKPIDELSEKFAHDESSHLELKERRTGSHNNKGPAKVFGFSVDRFVTDVKTLLAMMSAPKPLNNWSEPSL